MPNSKNHQRELEKGANLKKPCSQSAAKERYTKVWRKTQKEKAISERLRGLTNKILGKVGHEPRWKSGPLTMVRATLQIF